MASILRYSAVAALVSSVTGFAIAAPPAPTLPSDGDNFSPVPTAAPNLDLVKAKLAKKALTNTCTEWTVPGGFGQPYCAEGGTCVFYSDINGNYERCGTVGVDYVGITECWNYGIQTGLAPVSQIYCPASAPYCGYIAFVFGPEATFTNFGCSTDAYSFFADYIATTTDEDGTTITTQSSLTVAGPGASSTDTSTTVNVNSVVTVTSTKDQGAVTSSSTSAASGSAQTSSGGSSSDYGSHTIKKSTPTGAIAGGVVGGLAVIAIAGFLIFWFCVRKRPEKNAATQADAAQNAQTQQTTSSAYKPPNGVSEISGTAKPAAVASVTPVPVAYAEKPANGNTNQSAYTETTQNAPSPPPVYGNFQQQQAPPQHQTLPQEQQYPPQPYPPQQQAPPQEQQQYPPQQYPPQQQAPPQDPQQYPPQQYPPQQQAPPQDPQQYPPQQYPPQQQAPPQDPQQYPPQQYPPQQYPPQQYAAEQHPQQYPVQQHPQQYPPQQHPQQYPVPVPTSSPQNLAPSPGQQYREVAPGVDPRLSHPPVSPVGTSTYTQSPPMGTSELAGAGAGYQGHPPPQQNVNELGEEHSVSYQVTHNVQEMSGSSTGGIAGQPQPPQQGGGYDLSGNPTSGDWRGHELA